MANQTPAGRGPYTEYEWAVLTAMGARTIDFEATGPQTERSGVHNPDTDDLVTVELTREEAEWIVSITGYRNTAEGRKYKDPACGIDDKIRAALKGEA